MLVRLLNTAVLELLLPVLSAVTWVSRREPLLLEIAEEQVPSPVLLTLRNLISPKVPATVPEVGKQAPEDWIVVVPLVITVFVSPDPSMSPLAFINKDALPRS
jgi:hypothetical protein